MTSVEERLGDLGLGGTTWDRRSEKWVGPAQGRKALAFLCSGQPGVSLEALEQGSDMSGMHTGRLEGS